MTPAEAASFAADVESVRAATNLPTLAENPLFT